MLRIFFCKSASVDPVMTLERSSLKALLYVLGRAFRVSDCRDTSYRNGLFF